MIRFNKWQIQRFVLWFAPLLAWVILFGTLNLQFRLADGTRLFADDAPYRHMVMARSIQDAQAYQLRGRDAVPMTHDVLWQGLMAVGIGRVGDGITLALGLGLMGAALSLLLLLGWYGKLCPYPVCLGVAAAYAVLSPALYRVGFSGSGGILAMVLVLWAVQRHLTDLTRTGRGMPFSAVLLIGLALWIRLDLWTVWFALWLHTFLMASAAQEERLSRPAVIFRGLNGFLILALFILPLLAWNQRVIGVPWPRMPEVPLALDIWATAGPLAAWQATMSAMSTGAVRVWALFRTQALPAGIIGPFFAVVGMGLLIWRGVQFPRDRRYQILWILPVVCWLLSVLCYPYMGAGSGPTMAAVTAPFMLVLAAYGAMYVPLQFGRHVLRWWPRWPERRWCALWWGVVGALLLGEAVLTQARFVRQHRTALETVAAARTRVTTIVNEQGLRRDRFLTDQPGWLVWQHRLAVIDLAGDWSPSLLACLDSEGGFDPDRLGAYFSALTIPPTVAILWDPAQQVHVRWLQEPKVLWSPDDESPYDPLVVMDESSAVL